jgi:Ni,Fe-hydrogenase III large subunit
MPAFTDLLKSGQPVSWHRPGPRVTVDTTAWLAAADHLAAGRLVLLALWGEPHFVHMAVLDEVSGEIAVASFDAVSGRFPAISRVHAPAARLERTVRDLYGLEPAGAPDLRPWLDHGRWQIAAPLGAATSASGATPYVFLPAEGESLHQIPVGPVHAGIIEPGHFRFTANGETVVRLEERLGYVHKGVEGLMHGADIDYVAKLAGRISGDSTVAYALTFARAAETALGAAVPARAIWLRALMAELERIANHLGDIGAVCNDAAFALMHAHCGVLRERVLRAADIAFGHRLMRDCVVPGGVSIDLASAGIAAITALLDEVRRRFPPLITLYDETASLQDRTVGTGILRPALAAQYGAGGFIGRASGRSFDARRKPGYAPYPDLDFEIPVRSDGDVNARVWIRIREVEQSLAVMAQILNRMPAGPVRTDLASLRPGDLCEGFALSEGFRGDVFVWLRLDRAGKIERCHVRDPSWFQWPLLEAAIDGNIVADFPLCNKSFNCSYSGHDL